MHLWAWTSRLLLAMLLFEVLPCTWLEPPTAATASSSSFTCRFEPLDVCGSSEPLLGSLGKFPLLIPAQCVVPPPAVAVRRVPETGGLLPEGFGRVVVHPPEHLS